MWEFFVTLVAIILSLFTLPSLALVALVAVSALRFPHRRREKQTSTKQRFVVLIPAHDEAQVIGRTVKSILDQDLSADAFRVVVIADNCTDQTAAIAEAAGADVIRRTDLLFRGKGQALRYAIETIFNDPTYDTFTAITVIDADTLVDRGLLSTFAGELDQGREWLQGYYQGSNPDASWRTRLLVYALSLFNGVWLKGYEALGASVCLRGNGMCFSRAGLLRFPWKAFGLAEDLEFSWHLRLAGERVHFVPEAKVFGELVSTGSASVSQRQRWEHGRHVLKTQFLRPLLQSTCLAWPMKLLYLIDLYMLPLSKMAAMLLVAMILPWGHWWVPLVLLQSFLLSGLILYGLLPIPVMGIPARYLSSILYLPVYVFWKLLLVLKERPSAWVRTAREGDESEAQSQQVLPRLKLGNLMIDRLSFTAAVSAIMKLTLEKRAAYVVTPNADHLLLAEHNEEYQAICAGADLVLADGMPLVLASRLLGERLPERVTGADLVPGLCRAAALSGASVYFLGGLEGEAEIAAACLTRLSPGLIVAGTYFPPFSFEDDPSENARIVAAINGVKPAIVFMGVGTPKQEKWIFHNRHRLDCGVIIGVGAAIAFAAGTKNRAPVWMQKSGLEWLFRAAQEPRRLGMRYMKNLGIVPIVFRTWKQKSSPTLKSMAE